MTATEALCEATEWLYILPEHCFLRQDRPGETLRAMPEKIREALLKLTSTDTFNIRLDLVRLVVEECERKGRFAREYRERREREKNDPKR